MKESLSFRHELDTLERKIKLLIREHNKLKQELTESQRQNERLKSELTQKVGEISNFQNKFKISKLVGNMTVETEDSRELKEVLDDYIREIDKCIAHLSDA